MRRKVEGRSVSSRSTLRPPWKVKKKRTAGGEEKRLRGGRFLQKHARLSRPPSKVKQKKKKKWLEVRRNGCGEVFRQKHFEGTKDWGSGKNLEPCWGFTA